MGRRSRPDRRRGSSSGVALVAWFPLVGSGCGLILGLDEFTDAPPPGTGGAGGGVCAVDGARNGDETGTDCGGGACAPCPDGEGCQVGTDCESRVCVAGTCRPPTCIDGVQNGAEVAIDCGGAAASGCPGCLDGQPCHAGRDCTSGVCKGDLCVDYLVWVRQLDAVEEPVVSADSAGNAVVSGLFGGSVVLGGEPVVSAGDYDFPIARYDGSGKHLWSQGFGGDGFDYSAAPALDALDNIGSAGFFPQTIDFGGGLLTSAGGNDVFVAKLDPTGQHLWSQRFGGARPTARLASPSMPMGTCS